MSSAPSHQPAPTGAPDISPRSTPFTFRGQHPDRFERRSLAPVFGIGAAVPKTLLRRVPSTPTPAGPGEDLDIGPSERLGEGSAPESEAPAVVPSPAAVAARLAGARSYAQIDGDDGDDARDAGVAFTVTSYAALQRLGVSVRDAVDLVRRPDIVAPDDQQTPGREVHYSGDYGFICATERDSHGAERLAVLGVFERNRADGQAPESLREVKRSQPRYAGAGKATGSMPTSFDEVVDRVREIDGWSVEPGRGRYPWVIVSADGKHRHPVASGAHDFRAVRNFVGQLRASGLDVRRPAGGSKR